MAENAENRHWFIIERWQQFDGERHANLLRLLAIGVFYLIQLIVFFGYEEPTEAQTLFHKHATMIAAVWSLLALLVLVCLRRNIFPRGFSMAVTGIDIIMLTLTAWLGSKGESPLVPAYFLLIVLAGLRFSLPLIWFTTIGSMVGYLVLVAGADPVWFDADHVWMDSSVMPKFLLTITAIGLGGVMLGQIVRRSRALAESYAKRLAMKVANAKEPAEDKTVDEDRAKEPTS